MGMGMKKRIIGALVLASLSWWSVPTAFASVFLIHSAAIKKAASSPASKAHNHDCCPGLHLRLEAPLFVALTPPAMPCGDEHPCCAKHAPDHSFSLPAVNRMTRPGPDSFATGVAQNDAARSGVTSPSSGRDVALTFFARSTVLRI
jgi:hypothetical protein